MGWSSSNIFTQTMYNPLMESAIGTTTVALPTGYSSTGGVASGSYKAALYGNSGTPLNTDTLAHIAYNGTGGPWVTANEISGTGYTAGGAALGSLSFGIDATATNALAFHAANSSWTGATIANAYGDLVYCTSISGGTGVANQGFCFNYFGGAQSVTGGTFTVQWYSTGYSSGTVFSVTT